jgi:DNA-binding NtrC family response regulator
MPVVSVHAELREFAVGRLERQRHAVIVVTRWRDGLTQFHAASAKLVVIDVKRPTNGCGVFKLLRKDDSQEELALSHFEAAVRADPEFQEAACYRQATSARLRSAEKTTQPPGRRCALSRLFGRD